MDQTRFQEMKLEVAQLTILGTLLLMIQNSTSPDVTGHTAFMDRMKSLVRLLLKGVGSP